MRHQGFTVIELVIVMAIIGLLAGIAIPRLSNTKERAQLAAMKSDLRNLVTIEENYFLENMRYTADPGSAFAASLGNRMPTITLTNDGWTALITSPNTAQTCAVFIGSTRLAPAETEGAPACAKGGSTTVLP